MAIKQVTQAMVGADGRVRVRMKNAKNQDVYKRVWPVDANEMIKTDKNCEICPDPADVARPAPNAEVVLEQPVEPGTDPIPDLHNFSVPVLIKLAEKSGVKVPEKAKKEEIIELVGNAIGSKDEFDSLMGEIKE